MSHPYEKFENTPLWKVINQGINDLVENNDIEESTKREYIVGYLCKLITKSNSKNK
ncbi:MULTISPECIES: hypothetical protein [unclassified Bacillus (in: firmicutes)]|uniref:hypothetical protein n=1 Tax=unclassified Bacillus (in: firmicutes) TaxID=185979 RepID=UPI001596D9F2|nr:MULTISPECIES: hypothetical protein [unclassified Bacillus (in: firmicutes)]